MVFTIESPRPAPPRLRATSARVKRSKARSRNSCRKSVAAVTHVELDPPVVPCGLQPDLVAAVAERVVDEVAERLLEPHPVCLDDEPVRGRSTSRSCRLAPRATRSGSATEPSSSCHRPSRGGAAAGLGPSARSAAGLRRAARADRPPRRTGGRASRSSSAVRRGAARARARCAAARAACAARGRHRRRSRAPARSRPRAARASRSASRRAARSSSPVGGTGSRSPGVSAEIAAARRRIDSTWPQRQPGEQVADQRRRGSSAIGPAISSSSRKLASVSARSCRVAPTTSTSRWPPR